MRAFNEYTVALEDVGPFPAPRKPCVICRTHSAESDTAETCPGDECRLTHLLRSVATELGGGFQEGNDGVPWFSALFGAEADALSFRDIVSLRAREWGLEYGSPTIQHKGAWVVVIHHSPRWCRHECDEPCLPGRDVCQECALREDES